jgi:phosphopantothenoylcysteine decarboxylase/phosphopantothenate--cysteine ligase
MSEAKAQILVVVTGSIAAYKACEAVSQLAQLGHSVRVVATEAALRFVGAATWEGLTGRPVLSDLFAAGAALEHIELSRWADLTLVCPATADRLNRFAAGLADDLPGALFLARDVHKPFLVAPAMNPAMWQHPATAAAVDRLRSWGVEFIEVGTGRTACGELGMGRLAEPDQIVAAVAARLVRPARRLRVLVTSGGTSEPIDGVRVITNLSSGATGAGIAEHFSKRGHDAVLLRGRGSAGTGFAEAIEFGSTADLAQALQAELAADSFDAVIHAAAVSDFTVSSIDVAGISRLPTAGKIPSDQDVTVHLTRTPKLVTALREHSRNPEICVIAFKLTVGASVAETSAAVAELFQQGDADLVVHNDLKLRLPGGAFPGDVYERGGRHLAHCDDRQEIAAVLERYLLSITPLSYAPVS